MKKLKKRKGIMQDWDKLPQAEKDKICNWLHHRNWLEKFADIEYDAYANGETVFAWKERQMRRLDLP